MSHFTLGQWNKANKRKRDTRRIAKTQLTYVSPKDGIERHVTTMPTENNNILRENKK